MSCNAVIDAQENIPDKHMESCVFFVQIDEYATCCTRCKWRSAAKQPGCRQKPICTRLYLLYLFSQNIPHLANRHIRIFGEQRPKCPGCGRPNARTQAEKENIVPIVKWGICNAMRVCRYDVAEPAGRPQIHVRLSKTTASNANGKPRNIITTAKNRNARTKAKFL